MKVSITKESKERITLAKVNQANNLVNFFKNDDSMSVSDWAEVAARNLFYTFCEFTGTVKVLAAKARIDVNRHIHDYWTEDTDQFDAWIEFTAYDSYGCFLMAGAFLADIIQLDGNRSETSKLWIGANMWYRFFDERSEDRF